MSTTLYRKKTWGDKSWVSTTVPDMDVAGYIRQGWAKTKGSSSSSSSSNNSSNSGSVVVWIPNSNGSITSKTVPKSQAGQSGYYTSSSAAQQRANQMKAEEAQQNSKQSFYEKRSAAHRAINQYLDSLGLTDAEKTDINHRIAATGRWNTADLPTVADATKFYNEYKTGQDQAKQQKINDINALYQKYFGRNADQPGELEDKMNLTNTQIEDFLKSEYKKYSGGQEYGGQPLTSSPTDSTGTTDQTGTTDSTGTTGLTQEQKDAMNQLNTEIDNMKDPITGEPLTMAQRAVLKQIASQDWGSGQKLPNMTDLTQIIKDAATNAESDYNLYYQKTEARDLQDLQNSMADIRQQAANYEKSDKVSYAQKLAETRQALRQRGLTFSGASREQLGGGTALKAGGLGVEGAVPENRRINYENQISTWQQQGRDTGLKAERLLGSSKVGDLGTFSTPYGNKRLYNNDGTIKTGDLQLEKLGNIEKRKWDILSKYRPRI